jgi:hypothetical protein
MKLERLTLFRDDSIESIKSSKLLKSAEISNLLGRNNMRFIEVYANPSRLTPSLMKPGVTYRGYKNILNYVNSLYPSKQDRQSNQE